jgi:hypothetical protein
MAGMAGAVAAPDGAAAVDAPAAPPGGCAEETEPSRASRPRPREGRFVAIADYYAARIAGAQETKNKNRMGITGPHWRPLSSAVGLGALLLALVNTFTPFPARAAELAQESPPAAPAAPNDASNAIAGSPSAIFSAGVFALVEKFDYPYSLGAALYARPTQKWRLVPGGGIALGPDGMAYAYLDLRRDFFLGKRWYCTPSLAGGVFRNGDEIGTGADLEFQTGISFAREFANGMRLGLSGLHISNAGLSHPNNGTESIVLFLQLPL